MNNTTNRDYDLGQARQLATQTLMGGSIVLFIAAAIIVVMHYQWGYLRPLLLQSVLGFKTLAGAPIVQVWVLGYKPEGDLTRPWRAPNPFGYVLRFLFDSGAPEAVTPKEVAQKEKKDDKKKISSKASKKTD